MYASLTKKDLPRGRWRKLSEREIQLLHLIVQSNLFNTFVFKKLFIIISNGKKNLNAH